MTLKNKIFLCFIAVCFGVVLLLKNTDYFFWDVLDPRLSPDVDSNTETLPRLLYFLLNIAIFIAAAFIFYRLTARAVRKETERKAAEQNLIFAAIAHDLKTPMTSVQGFAKALADGKIRPEEQQEIFELIYRKTVSMDELVNMLFDYAKLGTSGYKPTIEELDLCSLVRDIAAEHYTDLEEHGIEPEIDIPEESILIKADRSELKRAIANLVVNIYKHNPDGIRAEISVKNEDGHALIRIADSGSPLPEGMDIFEPFVTENTARTAGHGTGLGLAITKRIIERHGGRITVETGIFGYTKAFLIRL